MLFTIFLIVLTQLTLFNTFNMHKPNFLQKS